MNTHASISAVAIDNGWTVNERVDGLHMWSQDYTRDNWTVSVQYTRRNTVNVAWLKHDYVITHMVAYVGRGDSGKRETVIRWLAGHYTTDPNTARARWSVK